MSIFHSINSIILLLWKCNCGILVFFFFLLFGVIFDRTNNTFFLNCTVEHICIFRCFRKFDCSSLLAFLFYKNCLSEARTVCGLWLCALWIIFRRYRIGIFLICISSTSKSWNLLIYIFLDGRLPWWMESGKEYEQICYSLCLSNYKSLSEQSISKASSTRMRMNIEHTGKSASNSNMSSQYEYNRRQVRKKYIKRWVFDTFFLST